MATRMATKRLTKEYQSLQESSPPYIEAHPSESNILEWYYVITGPPDTPYEGGQYMGTLMFPPEYPYKPPAIRMTTPSGRFEPKTRICLSISDYHPRTWNPAWSVSTVLVGLLSFMCSDEQSAGSIHTTDLQKRKLCQASFASNLNNPIFCSEFPHLAVQNRRKLREIMSSTTGAAQPKDKMTSTVKYGDAISPLAHASQKAGYDNYRLVIALIAALAGGAALYFGMN